MHPEALILRRCYPVPVTFADLRCTYARAKQFASVRAFYGQTGRMTWTFMLKEHTGALDEVYAVVDGREVRVAVAKASGAFAYCGAWSDIVKSHEHISDLLDKADREGYWERPHEVRLDLSPRPVLHGEVAWAVLVGQEYVERHGNR